MKPKNAIRFVGLSTVALLLTFAQPEAALAQHGDHEHQESKGEKQSESKSGHSHAMAARHSGSVTMTPNNHFEVLTTGDEIRLYAYDKKQNPITSLKEVKASVTLEVKGGKSKTLDFAYMAPDPNKGRVQGFFLAQHDFTKMVEGSMKATVHIEGMGKEIINFKSAVLLAEAAMYACPMHANVTGEDPASCPKCGMNMEMMQKGGMKMQMKGGDGGHSHGDGGH